MLDTPVLFPCGAVMKNRFMLAPMTNTQSYEDGQLSDDEFQWLTMRAKGQFGLVMTCAAHVQAIGKGFPGQLGIYADLHISGHQKLAAEIQSYGSLAVVQLHHAGMRSPAELIHQAPVCPSDSPKHGARALSLSEVEQLKNDFIEAALRAKKSAFDGVEVHGAHGYILAQFLSQKINKRSDQYGGSLENRARLLFEIIDGIRTACGNKFLLGVRLSPKKNGMDLLEIKQLCQRLNEEKKVDFLDISLWDTFKIPEQEGFKDQSLLSHFTALDLKNIRLTVAGKIRSGADVQKALASGIDFVTIGRSAILHYDLPMKIMNDPNFKPIETPVSEDYLSQQGLGEKFIAYIRRWPDFVKEK